MHKSIGGFCFPMPDNMKRLVILVNSSNKTFNNL
ncbi:hypothetical protein SAMN04487850_1759 [Prevotella aff. ruminicola Tc2-24]|uniref:Uncharacterized protein n=1 Tax=Prevotella aff. ruminicola Tc2-24 TaxID=81582 RepID=A0A1I0PGW1_9BACT|nr:hypothetical protein SAMN04487850_1759 [Prevotella aff. ruminicola Tc2-24]